MILTDTDLDRLEAVGPKDGFATILWQDVHALIAEVRQWRAEAPWRQLAIEALQIIAGKRPCADPLMGNIAVAQWVLDRLPSPPRSEP